MVRYFWDSRRDDSVVLCTVRYATTDEEEQAYQSHKEY